MSLLLDCRPAQRRPQPCEPESKFTGRSYLVAGLDLHRTRRLIAVVGSGGKTSLMFALAEQLRASGRSVLTTTTTKIRFPSLNQSPTVRIGSLQRIRSSPAFGGGHITISPRVCEGKLHGFLPKEIDCLVGEADHILVEADGAAGLPVKAPGWWEPVIPSKADLVIVVVGLDCLGRPAGTRTVHRLDRFLELTQLQRGEPITPAGVTRLLTHPMGGLKNAPPSAAVSVFLNKADCVEPHEAALLAESLSHAGRRRFESVIVGSIAQRWVELVR